MLHRHIPWAEPPGLCLQRAGACCRGCGSYSCMEASGSNQWGRSSVSASCPSWSVVVIEKPTQVTHVVLVVGMYVLWRGTPRVALCGGEGAVDFAWLERGDAHITEWPLCLRTPHSTDRHVSVRRSRIVRQRAPCHCVQTYGPGALEGMLGWLRHVAQTIGKGDLAAEPLTETEEAQIYQQVRLDMMSWPRASEPRPDSCHHNRQAVVYHNLRCRHQKQVSRPPA